jgi:hypothetical protein
MGLRRPAGMNQGTSGSRRRRRRAGPLCAGLLAAAALMRQLTCQRITGTRQRLPVLADSGTTIGCARLDGTGISHGFLTVYGFPRSVSVDP